MSDMSEIIKASLEGIKSFADAQTVVGKSISTTSGVTVIPISKLSVGFIGGGADYGQKKISQSQNFGGGSGAGVTITPIAFLTISSDGNVNILSVKEKKNISDKLISFIDGSPEIINKIKSIML